MRLRSLLILLSLMCPVPVFAQAHPCDPTPPAPTSGTGTAGVVSTLVHCHSGVDPNGNAVTGFVVYDNGARAPLSMTRGATPSAAGLFEYTAPFTIPATVGLHTIETAALSGSSESPKGSPFALMVSLPRVAPAAPSKPHLRLP